MSQEDQNNSAEMTEKIEIFSTDDEKIKSFGELLTNDSSRSILQLLFKEELTANAIAQKTGVSLQLVKYHINKMQDMGIIKVSKIEKNSKAQDMKYYTATKFAIVILPKTVSEKAKESKSLLRSFKILYKFAGVGIATVSAFFATHSIQNFTIVDDLSQSISLDSAEPVGESGRESLTEEQESAPAPAPESEPTSPSGVDDLEDGQFMSDSESGETIEESLELAARKIDAAEANPAAGSGTGIISSEFFWPIIAAIAVLGIGLAIIFYWHAYKHPNPFHVSSSRVSMFGIVFLAFSIALKYFR